ncbi:MAG: PD40 domain-containing protein [Chloroflexi bacterium]|nr:PD40 domain-containing protein [Chloroflexota bacterium]
MTTNIFGGPASLILGPTGSYWDTAANIPRPNLHMPPIQLSKWSSDGKRIVYSQFANDHWDLNVVNADGTNQTGLTRPDPFLYILFGIAPQNVAPTWSPDNQQILFLSDRNGRWEFFVTDPSGANIRQVLKSVTDRISLRFDFENERIVDWIK